MRVLKPEGRIDLEHRAYFLRAAPGNSVLVASREGTVSHLSFPSTTVFSHRPASTIRAICPHPTEPYFAGVDGESGALVVQERNGKKIVELEAPRLHTGASNWLKQGFDDCYFDDSGEYLWLAAPLSDDKFELQLMETHGWSVVTKTSVEDQLGSSIYSFHGTGKPDLVSLWLGAGQDGQQVFWLRGSRSGMSCDREDELTNTTFPVFSRDGSEFLVVNEANAICRYAFAPMDQIGAPLESDEQCGPFAESLCYLDNGHALASTNEGRIFVVDTERMEIEEEVALAGHEPQPIVHYYRKSSKVRRLGTDISCFTKVGDVIIFIYRSDRGAGIDDWQDSLLWYSVKK